MIWCVAIDAFTGQPQPFLPHPDDDVEWDDAIAKWTATATDNIAMVFVVCDSEKPSHEWVALTTSDIEIDNSRELKRKVAAIFGIVE